jgi:hypothetical protein
MTRAADAVASILARLAPASPQNPGKPSKRKAAAKASAERGPVARPLRVGYSTHDGALSPTRCGATQTQTRSKRLDNVTTPQDVATLLAAIKNPVDYALAVFVGTDWRIDVRGLFAALSELVITEALARGWTKIARTHESEDGNTYLERDIEMLRKLVPAVLHELQRADACNPCHTTGKILDLKAQPKPAWVTCRYCLGTGRAKLGLERRAKALHMRKSDFKTTGARFAYDWLLAECTRRLVDAADAMREERGDYEDE